MCLLFHRHTYIQNVSVLPWMISYTESSTVTTYCFIFMAKKRTKKQRKQHKSELHKSYKTVAGTSRKSENNLRNNSFPDCMSFYLFCFTVEGLMVGKTTVSRYLTKPGINWDASIFRKLTFSLRLWCMIISAAIYSNGIVICIDF